VYCILGQNDLVSRNNAALGDQMVTYYGTFLHDVLKHLLQI